MNDLDPIILEDSLKILRENSDTPGYFKNYMNQEIYFNPSANTKKL